MKTIIISDLHNRVDWVEPFLSSISYDRVVFLGDYFDDFNDTEKDIKKSANWLKQSLQNSNRIHLMGTHDMWYRFLFNRYLQASGNTPKKSEIINKILSKEDWDLLKFYYFEQNFLLTHAGLHSSFVKDSTDIISSLKLLIDKAIIEIEDGEIDPILDAGIARGGINPFGGITWLDWHDEFEIVPNLNQIVGHTELRTPIEKSTINSKNYSIDTKNRHIGIIEKNVFSV
ncbi:MAG: metallophosphoesterase [Methanobacteriaceae archaeon]|nr:metallophosphoesterase [Methanobacteriaceae archaeon]